MKDYSMITLTEMTVTIKSHHSINKQPMHGKIVVEAEDKNVKFVENAPRGPPSVEVMRTVHSRTVRRPDGQYGISFHFFGDEPGIGRQLVKELKAVIETLSINTKNNVA